jgi:hypothetical protein
MASAFKKGDVVRQVMPAPIEGTITGFHVDQETGEVQFCVEHVVDGETRQRYFEAGDLEAKVQ